MGQPALKVDMLDLSLKGYQYISGVVVVPELDDFALAQSEHHHPIMLIGAARWTSLSRDSFPRQLPGHLGR